MYALIINSFKFLVGIGRWTFFACVLESRSALERLNPLEKRCTGIWSIFACKTCPDCCLHSWVWYHFSPSLYIHVTVLLFSLHSHIGYKFLCPLFVYNGGTTAPVRADGGQNDLWHRQICVTVWGLSTLCGDVFFHAYQISWFAHQVMFWQYFKAVSNTESFHPLRYCLKLCIHSIRAVRH